jgi:hypothetical protein
MRIVCAGVDACFLIEYSVAVHAHPFPSELLLAHRQYIILVDCGLLGYDAV